jgi:hypothetical protein
MTAADRPEMFVRAAAPDVDLGLDVPVDVEEQLATRAAWLYFVAENTQAQIGKKLGLTRVRVNRLLAYARHQAWCRSQSRAASRRQSSWKKR